MVDWRQRTTREHKVANTGKTNNQWQPSAVIAFASGP